MFLVEPRNEIMKQGHRELHPCTADEFAHSMGAWKGSITGNNSGDDLYLQSSNERWCCCKNWTTTSFWEMRAMEKRRQDNGKRCGEMDQEDNLRYSVCPDRTPWVVTTMAYMQVYMLLAFSERWWRDGVRDEEQNEEGGLWTLER